MCPTNQPTSSTATDSSTLQTFLGNPVEICLVTRDYKRTLTGLHTLGIGPWRVYTFTPQNTTNQTYLSQPSPFTLRVCFAQLSPTMVYEVIQPISGPNIFSTFLEEHGEGIHHIAYDCNNIGFGERIKGFRERGYECVQAGEWMGRNRFAFFGTEGKTGTCFETYEFPEDWVDPEPEEWFPAREGEDGAKEIGGGGS